MVRPPLTRIEICVLVGLALALLCAAVAGAVRRYRSAPPVFVVFASRERPQYVLDLNRASAEELGLLPGIGEVRARRIIEYREKNGRFNSLDDLRKVGISEKLLNGMSGRLMVGADGDIPSAGNESD